MSLQEFMHGLEREEAHAKERQEYLERLQAWLESEHKAALLEQPYRPFASRLPAEVLQSLTPAERDRITGEEEAIYLCHQPTYQARHDHRQAYLAAGGTEEAFEKNWRDYGENVALEARASEIQARAYEEGSVF